MDGNDGNDDFDDLERVAPLQMWQYVKIMCHMRSLGECSPPVPFVLHLSTRIPVEVAASFL